MPSENEVREVIAVWRERAKDWASLADKPGEAEAFSRSYLRVLAEDAAAVAKLLEALLPSYYGWADEREGGVARLEDAVPDDGDIQHLLPATAWDGCWAARRGDEVRAFPTREAALAWLEEGDAP